MLMLSIFRMVVDGVEVGSGFFSSIQGEVEWDGIGQPGGAHHGRIESV